jgi:CheY-like chemotaxis protein/DNA-directed RNA polymerase subunit RPC12/RpoP
VSTTVYFCAHCQANEETFEHVEGAHLIVRCQKCGYPVEEGVVDKGHVAFQRTKVLFIDDDQLLLGFFSDFAKAHDLHPLVASDGAAGLALAKRERPDLILLDVMMPHVDGFEVCRQMRADPDLQTTPIIIITAMADPKLSVKGFKAGATLAMHKPLETQRVFDIITTALALKLKPPTAA